MQEILVVVDMQNDFVTGPLGTPEARAILPKVAEKVQHFPGRVLFTRDTHPENYLDSREGKALPVPHCIRGTKVVGNLPGAGTAAERGTGRQTHFRFHRPGGSFPGG